MKDKDRNEKLKTAAQDLALLLAGTPSSKVLSEVDTKGKPLGTVILSKADELSKVKRDEPGFLAATHAAKRLYEFIGGYPGGGNRVGGRGSDHSDPTLRIAEWGAADVFVQYMVRMDDRIEQACKLLAEASWYAAQGLEAMEAVLKDPDDDWCHSCWRVKDHKRRPFMVPSQVVTGPRNGKDGTIRRTPSGTSNGKAGAPLCSWCYGFVLGETAWPPRVLIELRRDGVRVTTEAVDKAMGRKVAV